MATPLPWVRWTSLISMISGYLMFFIESINGRPHTDPWTIKITAGMAMGTLMWANMWFLIYPIRKKIIKAQKTPN